VDGRSWHVGTFTKAKPAQKLNAVLFSQSFGAVRESPFTGSKFIDQVPSDRSSRRSFQVKLLTALPDPTLFGFIAALTRLLWPVTAAAVDLEATPDCWIRFEETYDEFEYVNRGCYAD